MQISLSCLISLKNLMNLENRHLDYPQIMHLLQC